jgi:hypothetical protein
MQSRFRHDFSRVRVHADERAAEAADAIGAIAFTANGHIVFGTDRYLPETTAGRRLLAHELTHVVQQHAGLVGVGCAGDRHEVAADRAADRVGEGKLAALRVESRGGSPVRNALQKQEDPNKRGRVGFEIRPLTLDVNPAWGAKQRATMHAENVFGTRRYSPNDDPDELFAALLDALERLDKSLVGDAEQSVGLFMTGSGTSTKGSTAAKPSKDVRYLNSSAIDLVELFEIMNVLVLSVSKPKDIFMTPEKFRKDPIKSIFTIKKKFDALMVAIDDLRGKEASGSDEEKSAMLSDVLDHVREVKKNVQVELQAEKPAPTTTVDGPAPPTIKQTVQPKLQPWSRVDLFSFYVSQPGAEWGGISGNLYTPDGKIDPQGEIQLVKSANGTQRKFQVRIDKNGYQRSKLLETISSSDR